MRTCDPECSTRDCPRRSRLAMLRDIAIIVVCAAMIAGALADLWRPPPQPPPAEPAVVRVSF